MIKLIKSDSQTLLETIYPLPELAHYIISLSNIPKMLLHIDTSSSRSPYKKAFFTSSWNIDHWWLTARENKTYGVHTSYRREYLWIIHVISLSKLSSSKMNLVYIHDVIWLMFDTQRQLIISSPKEVCTGSQVWRKMRAYISSSMACFHSGYINASW